MNVLSPVVLPTPLTPVALPTPLTPVALPTLLTPVALPTLLTPVVLPSDYPRDFMRYEDRECVAKQLDAGPYDNTDEYAACKQLCLEREDCGGLNVNLYYGVCKLMDRQCTTENVNDKSYYILFERLNQNTIGKVIGRVRFVRATNLPRSWPHEQIEHAH